MIDATRIWFDRSRLESSRQRVPASDFVNAQYDHDCGVTTTDVLVIFSTPRSGSTLLCDLLRANGACLPHEYMQPAQYLPILADRWRCLTGDTLDGAAYVASLRRFRTFPNGWLGLNLHGSHLPYFLQLERHLSGVRFHYLSLVRANVIAQAVSYEIASQTGQWSSEFEASGAAPEYDFARLGERLRRIQHDNALVQAFLVSRQATYVTLTYEDLVHDPRAALRRVPALPTHDRFHDAPTLKRQAETRNAEWSARFAAGLLSHRSDTTVRPSRSLLARLAHVPRSWASRRLRPA